MNTKFKEHFKRCLSAIHCLIIFGGILIVLICCFGNFCNFLSYTLLCTLYSPKWQELFLKIGMGTMELC